MTLVTYIFGIMLLGIGTLSAMHPKLAERFLHFCYYEFLPGLNTWIRIERYYYRYHRLSGFITFAGGILLVYLSVKVAGFSDLSGNKNFAAIFMDAGAILLLIAGLLISFFGLSVFMRPSALKPIESWANQPVTRESAHNFFVKIKKFIRQLIISFPRLAGLFAALTGLFLISLAGN